MGHLVYFWRTIPQLLTKFGLYHEKNPYVPLVAFDFSSLFNRTV